MHAGAGWAHPLVPLSRRQRPLPRSDAAAAALAHPPTPRDSRGGGRRATAARGDGQGIEPVTGRDATRRPASYRSRSAHAPSRSDRTQRAVRPGTHTGSLAPTVTPARRANVSGSRPGWSTFAAHPWSLINDHRGRSGALRRLVSTATQRSACGAVVRGRAASGLRCAPYGRTKRSWAATTWRGGLQDGGESLVQRRGSARGDHPRGPCAGPISSPATQPGRIRRARGLFAYLARAERDSV
jgi:hypothetical protein